MTSGTTSTLFSVWGVSADDLWVSGQNGTLRHFVDGAWVDYSYVPAANVYALWGVDADHAWSGSSSGVLQHWDGVGWGVAN